MSADFSFSKITESSPVTMNQTFTDLRDIIDSLATLGAGTITSPRTNHKRWNANQIQNYNGSSWDNLYPIADWSSLVNKPAFASGRILYGSGTDATTNANLTTDGTKIHVGTASAFTGNYFYQLNNTDSALLVRQDGSAAIQTWNALGSDKMTLTAGGYLGIGITPQCNLHVYANGTGVQEVARLTANYTATNSGPLLRFTNIVAGGANPNINEYNLAGIGAYDQVSNWGGGLHFYTAPNGTAGGANLAIAMTIDPDRNVGIGTSTPAARLHVAGDSSYAFIQPSNGANAILYMRHGSLAVNSFLQSDVSQNLIFGTADAEKMRLTGSGDLGIGTTSPSSRLHIVGTSEQLRLGFDVSNYLAAQVDSGGGTTFSQSGANTYWSFYGDSASQSARLILNNNNANAYGALTEYRTQNTTRGYIGALKHGSAGDVLFTGETADAFGIRAETAIEFGIVSTGIGRWNTTGLAVGGLFTPLGRIDSRATSGAQLVASYDSSNYLLTTVASNGLYEFNAIGSAPAGIWSLNGTAAMALSQRMLFIPDGSVSVGAWGSNGPSKIQFSSGSVMSGVTYSNIGQNLYFDSSGIYRYLTSNFASTYSQIDGEHRWHSTSSGTAGNSITWNTGMRLLANGFLGLSVASPSHPVVVGSSSSDGNGAYCSVTGNWTNGSDLSKKTDVFELSAGLEEILQLNPVSFRYMGNSELQYGLIAQDVRNILPTLVEGEEPNLALRTNQLLFPIINAIKQLAGRVSALEAA